MMETAEKSSSVILSPDLQAMADDLMTMEEARAVLRISRSTILRGLQSGEIPGKKVCGQWRISRRKLEAYLMGTDE